MRRGTFERGHVPAHYNVPTVGEYACQAHAADECIHEGVTRRRCGLLLNYFEHLFHNAVLVHYFPLHIFVLVSAELAAVYS